MIRLPLYYYQSDLRFLLGINWNKERGDSIPFMSAVFKCKIRELLCIGIFQFNELICALSVPVKNIVSLWI